MKRSLIPICALGLIALGVTACGGSKTDADVFIYKYNDTYIASVREALKTEMEAVGVTYNENDGAGDQSRQTDQINTALANGSKMLIVNAVEQNSVGETIMHQAEEKDIPVIFFNREVKDAAVAYEKSCFIGTDPDEAGYMQGEMIAKALLENHTDTALNPEWDKDGDGKITYVMIRANVGNAEADGRTTYSVEECNRLLKEANPSFTLEQFGEDYQAEWDKAKAKEAMDNAWTADTGRTIELVIANNDDMAIGAIESLVSHGYNEANSDATKKLLVVGVDATASAQTYIANEQMYGSIKQDAVGMAKAIAAVAKNAKDGKSGDGLIEGTSYKWDGDVRKIRIPYQIYTGK